MANAKRFTDEEAREIRLLYESGKGSVVLAQEFKSDPHTIIATIKRAGGTIRNLKESRANRTTNTSRLHTPQAKLNWLTARNGSPEYSSNPHAVYQRRKRENQN